MPKTLLFLAALTLAAPAFAETREISLMNIKYQGRVIWLPSTIIVKKGETVKLTLLNSVPDDPAVHGFSIPAFGVKAEAERDKPLTVEFKADKAGLFETSCHLHPAHLKGQLLVTE
jgi:nitrosocyanin